MTSRRRHIRRLGDLRGVIAPVPTTGPGTRNRTGRWCNLTARRTDEHGSVLLLVPAGVLVIIILGAIALDFAVAFLNQRQLSSLAAAVANDAATAALSEERFYGGAAGAAGPAGDTGIEIDPAAARRLALEAVRRRAPQGIDNISVDTRTAGRQVCVTLRGDVRYVFSRAVPGAADGTTVEGQAVATAVEGPAGTAVDKGPAC